MKKLIVFILLALVITLSFMPASTLAYGKDDSKITWLGTQTEYQTTLDAFFYQGLRKVAVGDQQTNGKLANIKYGIIDATGTYVAPPIYDRIEPIYIKSSDIQRGTTEPDTPFEDLFAFGYVQAVRDGKMGLLNPWGEEVIPCQYYAVGLPSEGICRIYQRSDNKFGYWIGICFFQNSIP